MSYSVVAGGVVFFVLIAATYPLALRAARTDDDPALVRIMMFAIALKLIASLVRYWVAFVLYDGSADAGVYLSVGEQFANDMRQGDFSFTDQSERGGSDSTIFIRQLTGWVLFVTGPSRWAAFFVFSWFSFIGLYLFHRAFALAVPQGDGRRFAYLVFFLPTLLYWPSSVGKEAWMLMTLGLGAYGVARILSGVRGGYLITAIALAASAAVRPHMTVLLAAGLAAAFMVRRSKPDSRVGPAARVVGSVLILVGMTFAIQAAEERFGVEGEGISGAETVIDRTAEQTSKGGSEFEARSPGSLRDLPYAVFTVMFRPLPFEAHNAQTLVTSFEGVFLLGFVALSWPRLRRLPRQLLKTPYASFAAVYSLGFMVAFASFGNFGILARQRSQLFPLVLVLFALPIHGLSERRAGRGTGRRSSAPVLVYVPAADERDAAADERDSAAPTIRTVGPPATEAGRAGE
jgi:hypothetical protein